MLYVTRDYEDYYGRGAQDILLDFHAAAADDDVELYVLGCRLTY